MTRVHTRSFVGRIKFLSLGAGWARRTAPPTLSARTVQTNSHHYSFPSQDGTSAMVIRSFHATSSTDFPVRRRRHRASGGGTTSNGEGDSSSSNPPENPLKHEAVVNTALFTKEAGDLLTKLERSLESMKAKNEIFIISRKDGDIGEILTIDLGPKDGTYRIEISEQEHMFEYTSPISGKLLYILSADTGEWVGAEDGHLFEGLLVRDLIRQCQGLPNL